MRAQELNLLMVFDAVMTERSITRAANRLAMTQPAVSNAVSRMRSSWNDELFVKNGRNIQPTVYAQELWSQIKTPLSQITDAVDPNEFNPATAKRTFRIAVADIVVDASWLSLRKIIKQEAPHINILAMPFTNMNSEKMLEDAKVDLIIGVADTGSSSTRNEFLFSPHFVCVMNPEHHLNKTDLTMEGFAAAEHLFISFSGDTSNETDHILAQHGLSRRISMTVNHFSVVSPIIQGSDLICIAPSASVIDDIIAGRLSGIKPPFDLPPPRISLLWHKRQERDSGLRWLRNHLKNIILQETAKQEASLQALCTKATSACK